MDIAAVIKRQERLKAERCLFDSYFQELAEHIQPRKSNILSKGQPGEKRMQKVLDSTAIAANELFASSIHGMLINPSSQWFRIESQDDELNNDKEVSAWFDDVTDKLHAVLGNEKSNFTSSIEENLLDIGAFGTSALASEERYDDVPVRFDAWYVANFDFAENESGRVDTLFLEYKLSARQILQRFPEGNIHPKIREAGKKSPDTEFTILRLIAPREDYDSSKSDNKSMPFGSWYIDKDNRQLIDESGFSEFPINVCRWRLITGERYGRSQGMTALPDIKMLQAMKKAQIMAAEKIIEPPLQLPAQGFLGKIRTSAGALNFYNRIGDQRIEPINTVGDIRISLEMTEAVKADIRATFFNDQLQLVNSPEMTAYEVAQRLFKQLRLMAPMLGRVLSELIGPAIDRTFNIMLRQGRFLPIPEKLQGSETKIRYLSQLAQAQAATDVDAIVQTLQTVSPLAQVDPGVMDEFDLPAAAQIIARVKGFPPEALRKADAIQTLRQNRAKQAQDERQMQATERASVVAKNVIPARAKAAAMNGARSNAIH